MKTPRLAPTALLLTCTAALAGTAVVAPANAGHRPHPDASATLPLGPSWLTESRTTTTLARGVTHTTIVRGSADPALRWVVEVNMPSDTASPDPDAPPRSVQDRDAAQAVRTALAAKGIAATVSPVVQPRTVDLAGGVIGYRLRLTTTYATKAEADAASADVKAAGYTSRAWYTGWDGGNRSAGPWTVHVLTIDPRTFRGQLAATYGPDLEKRETLTALSALTKARAAINAGFFVMDPAAGAEGDPAGAGVYDGVLESETVAGRPAITFDEQGRGFSVVRPTWSGTASARGVTVPLDGINRVPGLIRNCGGDPSDSPFGLTPVHDYTCKDANEVVVLTPAFGARTPSGPGTEAVLDGVGRVVAVNPVRGTALAPGQRSIQGIGTDAGLVAALHVGDRVKLKTTLTADGRSLVQRNRYVVNGGPQLMANGRVHLTQATDGMAPADNPSFTYGWVLQRNPRTFAGRDAQGRVLLATVDGRQLGDLGLSIPETAAVAKALGMTEAMNLDGGGSTAMTLGGSLITHPSDATGERAVGDAIVVR